MKKLSLLFLTLTLWNFESKAQGVTFVEAYVNPVSTNDHLNFPWKNSVSPDGKHLYAAANSSDAVSYFSINPSTGQLTLGGVIANNTGSITGLDGPRCTAVSPDGKFVYVGSGTGASIVVFSRDEITGGLTFVEELIDDSKGGTITTINYVDEIIISPDGKHLYSCGASDDAVNVFSINSTSGVLTFVTSYQDIEAGGTFNYLDNARYWGMDVDGDNLYVGSGGDDAITVFSRNKVTGALTLVQEIVNLASGVTGIDNVRKIIVTNDGGNVYAFGNSSDAIAHFTRNTSNGQLTFVKAYVAGVDLPASVVRPSIGVVSPDDKYLFVTFQSGDAFGVFSINSTTGALTTEEVVLDDTKGGAILNQDGPIGLSMTPDGKFFFLSASVDDAINVFSNDDPPVISTLDVSLAVTQQVSCPGGSDGQITATVTPGVANYTYAWSNGAVISNTSSATNTISNLLEASYTLTVTDADGETAMASITIPNATDATDPTIASISNQTVNAGASCNATLPDYTGLAVVSDNCDGSPTVTQSPLAGTTISSTTLVTLTVEDVSGNSSSTSFDVSLLDATDPTIASISNQTVNAGASCNATIPDYTGLAVVSDNCDASPTVTQSPTAGTMISSTTLVTLTATDASGNSSSKSFDVTLVDNTDPTIVSMSSQTVDANSNCSASLPDYTGLAVVSDNCDASPTVTQSPTAGTMISSTTLVTLTATDASGNSSSKSFDVTLVDNTDPTIVSMSSQTVDANSNCSASLPDYTGLAVVSDNCDASPTVTQSPTAGTMISSTTLVTLTATDASGNSTSKSFDVTLVDVTNPVIPTLTTIESNCSVMPMAPTTTDNCTGTITGTTDTSFPITASTTITWSFKDDADNLIMVDQEVIIGSTDVTLSQLGTTLTANFSGADSYQWIDCNTGNTPLAGESSSSLTVENSGNYAVVIEVGACKDTSACTTFVITGFENTYNSSISVYPTVVTSTLLVHNEADKLGEIKILDVFGNEVVRVESTTHETELSLNNLIKGTYFLYIETSKGVEVRKFVKE